MASHTVTGKVAFCSKFADVYTEFYVRGHPIYIFLIFFVIWPNLRLTLSREVQGRLKFEIDLFKTLSETSIWLIYINLKVKQCRKMHIFCVAFMYAHRRSRMSWFQNLKMHNFLLRCVRRTSCWIALQQRPCEGLKEAYWILRPRRIQIFFQN